MLTPAGKQSVKPRPGRLFRRHLRMEQACRLEASGQFSNIEIAQILGITLANLQDMKRQPDYLTKRAEMATGVVVDLTQGLRTDADNIRQEIVELMPAALRVLRNAVQRGAIEGATTHDLKLGMEAAREVMDREGTFTKISRSEVKLKSTPNLNEQEGVEMDLLAMLQEAQKQKPQQENNSDGSSSRVTTQQVTLESFVSSAGDKAAQERMKQNIKLDDFNSDTVN